MFIFTEYTKTFWGIDQFFKIQTYGIKALSQYFEKEIYQYVHISIGKFLKAPILKNICKRLLPENVCMKLRKINSYSCFTLH